MAAKEPTSKLPAIRLKIPSYLIIDSDSRAYNNYSLWYKSEVKLVMHWTLGRLIERAKK